MKFQAILLFFVVGLTLQENSDSIGNKTQETTKIEEKPKTNNQITIDKNDTNEKERSLYYLGGYSPFRHPTLTNYVGLHSYIGPYNNPYPYYGNYYHNLGPYLHNPYRSVPYVNPYGIYGAGVGMYYGGMYPGGFPGGMYPGMYPWLSGMNAFAPFMAMGGMNSYPYGNNQADQSDPSDPDPRYRKLDEDQTSKITKN